MHKYLNELYEYNKWAQIQIWDAMEQLSDEEFTRDLGEGCGSIRDKLVHIYGADFIWFQRLMGEPRPKFPDASKYPDWSMLRKDSEKLREQAESWITGLKQKEEELENSISYVNLEKQEQSTPVWQVLLHVINHATYHRGQVASLYRRLKGSVPVTDLINFMKL